MMFIMVAFFYTFAGMDTPINILRKYWGYDTFRPMQEEIILSILKGKDTLALLPTGGGKSICFQVPALVMPGVCIVVSPLIALMKDQVEQLKRRGIEAAAIYSGMPSRLVDIVFENACQGAYKFIYLSPERLRTELALARIARMQVNMLAVDEAHCISQWGYDFRPPYLQIAELRELLGPTVPYMALTATATPEVVQDIQDKLEMRSPAVFQQSFVRQNLSYAVLYEVNKTDKLIDILQRVPGTAVVYMRSRGETKRIAELLQKKGISADYYHAGLEAETRSKKQDDWIQNKIRVIVSTNAFGMGIDKPDVRTVVHLSLPESLEAYFQEAGRGGRDGKKAYSVLLYTPEDSKALRHHLESSYPDFEYLRKVYKAIGSYLQLAVGAGLGESFDFDIVQFCNTYQLKAAVTYSAIKLLEQEGYFTLGESADTVSKLHIPVSREVVYDFILRNPAFEALIKSILRSAPGVHQDILDINEYALAKSTKCSAAEIIQSLEMLQKEGIVWYQPRKTVPQLVFTRERVPAENLSIDWQKFNFRKQKSFERVEAAIAYAEKKECRSKQLISYFGEIATEECGICDICTNRTKKDFNKDDRATYSIKIQHVLRHGALPLEEILKAFAPNKHDVIIQVLMSLEQDGSISRTEDNKLNWL